MAHGSHLLGYVLSFITMPPDGTSNTKSTGKYSLTPLFRNGLFSSLVTKAPLQQ